MHIVKHNDVLIWNGKRTQVKLDYNAEMWKLFVALHWAIGHQAIYTSVWSAVTSRVSLSTTCCWKKWLVHVRIHNPVGKIFINVVTPLNVQVLFLLGTFLQSQERNSATQENGTNGSWDYRYFSGLYLFFRAVLLVGFIFLNGGMWLIIIPFPVVVSLLFAHFRPYKNGCVNIIDSLVLL